MAEERITCENCSFEIYQYYDEDYKGNLGKVPYLRSKFSVGVITNVRK